LLCDVLFIFVLELVEFSGVLLRYVKWSGGKFKWG
jgi:hypothetical protein